MVYVYTSVVLYVLDKVTVNKKGQLQIFSTVILNLNKHCNIKTIYNYCFAALPFSF